jgi:hypothetical protein
MTSAFGGQHQSTGLWLATSLDSTAGSSSVRARPCSVGHSMFLATRSWIAHSPRGERLLAVAAAAAIVAGRHGTTSGHPVAAASRPPSSAAAPGVTKTVTASPTPSPTLDIADIYAREQSGVVRIETLSCSDAGIGTGFLLSPTLIATVNHVIDQFVVVSLIDGDQRTTRLLGVIYTPNQMSYDLGRLRLNGLIERLEGTNTYLPTPDGQRVAIFYSKVHNRLLRPWRTMIRVPAG